jgi:phage tail-like protein
MPGGVSPPGENDALTAVAFGITVDGLPLAQFSELVELSSGLDPSGLELGPNQRRAALKQALPTVTLLRGQTNDLSLSTWHHDALAAANARRDVVLTVYSTAGAPVAKYNLESAWPARIEITGVKAGASQVLVERVTFACEHIQRVAP